MFRRTLGVPNALLISRACCGAIVKAVSKKTATITLDLGVALLVVGIPTLWLVTALCSSSICMLGFGNMSSWLLLDYALDCCACLAHVGFKLFFFASEISLDGAQWWSLVFVE